MNVFELKKVGFAYPGQVPALEDVSLTVTQGERLALLGANGSGKSTLLKVLGGLLAPVAGEARAFGAPLAPALLRGEAALAFRRRVGVVFQSADAMLFNPTVRDEIAFAPLHLGLPAEEVERRVADMLELLELEPLAGRAPYRLSGGEKKKVALAAVLAAAPEVLLVDEPTAGLDPRAQDWLVEFLRRLHEAGKTLVVATHLLAELPRLADRAVVLGEDHRVAGDLPVADLLADRELLLRVNLIHEHAHRHGDLLHSHPHAHVGDEHPHDAPSPGQPPTHEHGHEGPTPEAAPAHADEHDAQDRL